MNPAAYLEHVGRDGVALAAAARQAPKAAVASCPEWDMTALVGHTAGVHHWVAEIVTTKATERIKRRFSPEMPKEADAVLDWYDEGLSGLLDVLGRADPDEPVWNWFDRRPAPTSFWHRRMAHETAVHRWDAQAAANDPQPLDPALSVDGIDEFLTFVAADLPREPIGGLTGSLHLHATDIDGEWHLELAPDHLDHRRQHTKADAALRGTACDLMLWLVGRQPAAAPMFETFGDLTIIDAWKAVTF
jgi:uncharacterized protein (TIGR03083 family)